MPTKFLRLIDGVEGRWLAFAHDQFITPSLAILGAYSPLEVALCRQYLASGDAVIVVGANIGAVAVPLAVSVWPGPVLAMEPQPLMAMALGGNALLHGCDNLVVREAAAGAVAGTETMAVADPRTPANTGGISLGGGTFPVQVVRLDDVAGEMQPRLLHIDAEGMEPDVLEGARALVARSRPIIVAEIDRDGVRDRTIALLRDMGYTRLWEHTPPLIGQYVSCNVVAVPDGAPDPADDGALRRL